MGRFHGCRACYEQTEQKHNYGVQFYMLSVDEGIKGYRDDSL